MANLLRALIAFLKIDRAPDVDPTVVPTPPFSHTAWWPMLGLILGWILSNSAIIQQLLAMLPPSWITDPIKEHFPETLSVVAFLYRVWWNPPQSYRAN